MKRLLIILTLLVSLTSFATVKPLPWDKPLVKKTFKVCSPITEVDIFMDYSQYPYGYLSVIVKRPYAYTTCEYTTIEVWGKMKFRVSAFPTTYQWLWGWVSFTVTIPANSNIGYINSPLQEGEEYDVNTYMSPGYLDYCY